MAAQMMDSRERAHSVTALLWETSAGDDEADGADGAAAAADAAAATACRDRRLSLMCPCACFSNKF